MLFSYATIIKGQLTCFDAAMIDWMFDPVRVLTAEMGNVVLPASLFICHTYRVPDTFYNF